MNWADSAILAAAGLAAVNIIDSHLITKRFRGLSPFLLPAGIIALVYGISVLVVRPLPPDVGGAPLLVAGVSGAIRAAGILLFLFAMRTEEVSRVIPVANIHPVLVAIMAVPLLGESLVPVEWVAVLMTVAGAVLISRRSDSSSPVSALTTTVEGVGPGQPGNGRFPGFSLAIIPFLAALCLALANLTSKYALDDISFWNMYAIGSMALGAFFIAVACRPAAIRHIRRLERPLPTVLLLLFNETLAPIGAILLFWSIERGPVSLVSAIAGVQPVFVFVFALVISRVSSGVLLERRMAWRTVGGRFLAIAMIVGGITIIHLA